MLFKVEELDRTVLNGMTCRKFEIAPRRISTVFLREASIRGYSSAGK